MDIHRRTESPRRNGSIDGGKAVCLLCRQRKVRCGKQRPSCEHCVKLGVTCQYIAEQKKPGLRAGYVSELERRLTILEQEVRDLKTQRQDPTRSSPASQSSASLDIQPQRVTPKKQIDLPRPRSTAITEPPSRAVDSSILNFDPLAPQVLLQLCTRWFAEFQAWFPILHQPTALRDLQDHDFLSAASTSVVFKSMAAFVLPHWQTNVLTSQQKYEISIDLRNQVLTEAMGKLSLRSLQAVLILIILDWVSGKLSEAWNLMALGKRMSMQLGLRDLVAYQCKNYNKPSAVPPRMLPLPSTLVDREEKIRAFWMIEMLDCTSTIGASWNLGLSRPEGAGLLPCSEIIWTLPEFEVPLYSDMNSNFALLIDLCTKGVWFVHKFLQTTFDLTSTTGRARWRSECRAVDERLLAWRHETPAAAALERLGDYPEANGSAIDPNIVMVCCTFNTAIIALHQRLAMPPSDDIQGPWYHAIQRCIDACDNMAQATRILSEPLMLESTPYIAFCLFVAARFYIVHSKTFNTRKSPNLDTIVEALRVYGTRWAVARRFEKVIRTAMDEQRVHSTMTSLPAQFYDLQYSSLDIDEALRVWAENMEPWYNLPSLDQTPLSATYVP